MLCFGAAMLAAPSAFADPATDRMNALNEEGFREFKAGRYATAALRFQEAYEASPDPNLRKNEAIAWFKAGRCDEAIPAANAFLIAGSANEADALEARSIVANCKVEMARDAIRAHSWSLAGQLLNEAESLQPDQYASDQIALARVDLAQRRQVEERGPSVLGWVFVGTGAAIIGGTFVYWALTIPDRAAVPTDPGFDRSMKRARTSRWLVPTAFAVGGALTGTGIYLVLRPGSGDGGGGSSPATAALGVRYRW